MGSSSPHTLHLLSQCPWLPPPRRLPSHLLPSFSHCTWAPLEAAFHPTSSTSSPPSRPSGSHWILESRKCGFWRLSARESSGAAESEEFSVLAAVRSEYNEIVIVEAAKSRFLLLDSTRIGSYPFIWDLGFFFWRLIFIVLNVKSLRWFTRYVRKICV